MVFAGWTESPEWRERVLADPVRTADEEVLEKAQEQYEAERVAWLRKLERCVGSWDKEGMDELQKDLPAVAFLAPDGSILSVLRQPTEESQLLEAVKAVPPLLAKWVTERREPPPPAPPANGIRP